MHRRHRFDIARIALLSLLLPAFTHAAPPYATQLATECDALIQCAIHRPYGDGWTPNATPDAAPELSFKPTPHPIAMAPLCTPAAGLVILLAGEELHEPRYHAAAQQVARGIAICQKSIGRVPGNPTFSRAPIVIEERAVVADRTPTRCALGLLLALLDEAQPPGNPATEPSPAGQLLDDPVRRSAARASDWLSHQIAPANFWPSAFPPDAPANVTIRIARFDTTDYRDCTIALLLSSQLLQNPTLQRLAVNPLHALQKVILKSDMHGPHLWNTAVTIDGAGTPSAFPRGPDVLASRFNMQTLLVGYSLLGEPGDQIALQNAAASLRQSNQTDGRYSRFLDPTVQADIERINLNVPSTQSIFAQPPPVQPATAPAIHSRGDQPITPELIPPFTDSFAIPALLQATDKLKTMGRERYLASIASPLTVHQQLEATLCGLMDDPLSANWPATADAVPAWLSANSERLKMLDGPPPQDLPGKVRRLWLLLLRCKLERIAAATAD